MELRYPSWYSHFFNADNPRKIITPAGPDHAQIAAAAGIAGITNVVILAAFLAITERLEGPTVLPFGGPVVDASLWAVIGAAVGVFLASWKGPPFRSR